MEREQPRQIWSTRTLAASRQFDAFREAVSETHLPWDLPSRREAAFSGQIRQQAMAGGRVIECNCDPCEGRRGPAELHRSGDAWYGVLFILRGRERIRQGRAETWLAPGDFALWDSTRPIDFAVDGVLHKITLLVPHRLLDGVLPQACDLVAARNPTDRGRGALFASHLRTLARHRRHIEPANVPGVFGATLDLLAATLLPRPEHERHDRPSMHLVPVQQYILSNLGNSLLSPLSIARAHGISVRQLHRAFEHADMTLERWIWDNRLIRCRHDLLHQRDATISQIAFAWGFSDAGHFSRAFRAKFGLPPRDLRKLATGVA